MIRETAIKFVSDYANIVGDHTVEYISDCPEEYKTYQEVQSIFHRAMEDNEELFEDYINDLVSKIREEYKKTKLRAVQVTFDSNGFSNAAWGITRVE